MEHLKFRRQFLLTPVACAAVAHWPMEQLDDYLLYVHPDCPLTTASGRHALYLIGHLLDPHHPEKNAKELLQELSQEALEHFPKRLYPLVGRFVLLIKQGEDFILYNDACGLKTCYYTKSNEKLYAASQPLLLGQVLKIEQTPAYAEYLASAYVAENKEHWLPSGITGYEHIHHLVPNHSLRFSEYRQERYYPHERIQGGTYPDLLHQFAGLLKQIVSTGQRQMDLAFSLTAGWDSRILLSSCKDSIRKTRFYTLRYRNMKDAHMDISVPTALANSLHLNHSILDCQKEITPAFAEIYKQNSPMAHLNDWGKIAFGMYTSYPQDKVAVKGNCSEIGRCFYAHARNNRNPLTAQNFSSLELGWRTFPFIKEGVAQWLNALNTPEQHFGYNLFDLFYWEHRMGSWQAQSQLEWDMVQEVFTPFNSRELLDIMFAIDPSKRKTYSPLLYKDTMQLLWGDVLSQPINPLTPKQKLIKLVLPFLKNANVYALLKRVLGAKRTVVGVGRVAPVAK